jgi:hypothetical protein
MTDDHQNHSTELASLHKGAASPAASVPPFRWPSEDHIKNIFRNRTKLGYYSSHPLVGLDTLAECRQLRQRGRQFDSTQDGRSAGFKISASEVFQYVKHQCPRFLRLAFTIAISLIDRSIVLRHMMKPLAHHLCSVALRLTVLNHSWHFRTAVLGQIPAIKT